LSNCEVAKSINFDDKTNVAHLVETILARLASTVNDKLLCDIFCLLTEHANRNLSAC
jgi:hypothetical protein